MIDEQFQVHLIECNTNPSLEVCSPLMARIVTELLDNSFRIAVDPLFQPAFLGNKDGEEGRYKRRLELLSHIKYNLIFDEVVDGPALRQLFAQKQDQDLMLLLEIKEEEKQIEKDAITNLETVSDEEKGTN